MVRAALFGLGKMGISHQSIINAHPDVQLVAVCDTTEYLLSILEKYTSVKGYGNYRRLLEAERLDAVFVATPSRFHGEIVGAALDANLHVFCEKPFCLDPAEGVRLAQLAEAKKRVNQVGYHYRFVGIFQEMKRLIDLGVVGKPHHLRAEAYGPVVLRSGSDTWRTARSEGGGCLYDYASHAIDLLNFVVGRPEAVGGTVMNKIFSRDVEDEVYTNLYYANGMTGQVAANWSDESQRKMSASLTIWGTGGKITANRQELQIYIRDHSPLPEGFNRGWNVRYTTDLTEPVWFYLRGEEYSAQIDHFIQAIKAGRLDTRSTFRSAIDTDLVTSAIIRDAHRGGTTILPEPTEVAEPRATGIWGMIRRARKSPAPVPAK